MTQLPSEEIRKLVREVLKEALPVVKTNGAERQVSVRIITDDDLNAFAREIAKADEAKRAAIAAGQLRFTLSRPDAGTQTRNGTHRLDKGVLTEAMVIDIGRANNRVIVAKGVAITPLARDKAREVKLEIVRDKP